MADAVIFGCPSRLDLQSRPGETVGKDGVPQGARRAVYLKAVAARTGQLPNYADPARDCSVSVNTARNWMTVLQASHQVFLLPAWPTNLSKRLYTTPKLHVLDTGLCA